MKIWLAAALQGMKAKFTVVRILVSFIVFVHTLENMKQVLL